jgi:hypothetical protein
MITHPLQRKGYNYGLIAFCTRKKLNLIQVVDMYVTEHQFPAKTHAEKQSTIDRNWKKFAAWVNEKLNNKEIKGENVSTSNGSEEEKKLRRQQYAQYPQELKDWYKVLKAKAEWSTIQDPLLSKFFKKYDLGTLPQRSSAELTIGKQQSRYQVIVDNNLLEEFKLFTLEP